MHRTEVLKKALSDLTMTVDAMLRQTINAMTIPNIGYKANSIYERDAIFDELEKMGYPVRLKEKRLAELGIVSACDGFIALNGDAETWCKSPESFLAAAREALKPKYPTETLHAKCNSPYELRGCIEALHKAGVRITPGAMLGSDDATHPNIGWIGGGSIVQFIKEPSCREIPLSEFMDIFLKPEPKRETPPKIVGRKYRATSDGLCKRYYMKGDVLKLITDDGSRIPWFWNDRIKDRVPIDMDFVELLPEEPWTAEYKEFNEVWIKGSVTGVSDNSVRVSPYVNMWNDSVSNPSHIKKA